VRIDDADQILGAASRRSSTEDAAIYDTKYMELGGLARLASASQDLVIAEVLLYDGEKQTSEGQR
jgi:hypothetical protein